MTTPGKTTDAEAMLRALGEALVVSFAFLPDEGRFELVCALAGGAPAGVSRFSRMVFEQVASFRRERGLAKKYRRFQHSYRLGDVVGPIVVQSVRSQGLGGGAGSVDLWFGPSFGGVAFRYGELEAWLREGTSVKRGDQYMGLDCATGEEFDMRDPFPPAAR